MISVWHMMPDSWVPGSACRLVKYVQEGGEEMPDMALCQNVECPSRWHCYRFTVQPSCHQVYARFTVEKDKDRCGCYIPSQMDLPLDPKAQV